jgi:hypothetical protein
MKYDKPIHELIKEAGIKLTEIGVVPFGREDIFRELKEKYSDIDKNTVNPIIQGVTVNLKGGANSTYSKNILISVGRGKFELYNQEKNVKNELKVERKDNEKLENLVIEGIKVDLIFNKMSIENVFSYKNNKTLAETLNYKKYEKLFEKVEERYKEFKEKELGFFLLSLKNNNDCFYKKFLNKYGDEKYCNFFINDKAILSRKGIYYYKINSEVVYIGRCLDNYNKRINQGYGRINPKNCYIDGQSTNCHLNSLINSNCDKIELFVLLLNDDKNIKNIEKKLIKNYQPIWNVSLK